VDEALGRKKAMIEEQQSTNIAKVQADEREYKENSAAIEKHYLSGDAMRKASDPRWQKMAFWNMRNDARKRPYIRKNAQVLAQPEAAQDTCRKIQPRGSHASRPEQTANTMSSTAPSNQTVQRRPSVDGMVHPALQIVIEGTPSGKQQRFGLQPSKMVIDRPQPSTLSSSESSPSTRASQPSVVCPHHPPPIARTSQSPIVTQHSSPTASRVLQKSQVLLWIRFLPQLGVFNHPHSEKREYLRPFIT
jgi:hypothetical protein